MTSNKTSQHLRRQVSAGKAILYTVAGLTAAGGFLADWNRTHLFNPDWPPHAKFHDGWTITLGTMLGSTGLYFLLRNSARPTEDLTMGTLLPTFFWAAQGASFLYPGAKGLEVEFPELVPKIRGVWLNELPASLLMLALTGTGYMLERRRLRPRIPKT